MKATLRNLRVSPRKARLVVDLVRGKGVEEALSILTFTHRAASKPVKELVRSAWANAEERDDELTIEELLLLFDRLPFVHRHITRKAGSTQPHGDGVAALHIRRHI